MNRLKDGTELYSIIISYAPYITITVDEERGTKTNVKSIIISEEHAEMSTIPWGVIKYNNDLIQMINLNKVSSVIFNKLDKNEKRITNNG